jgi:type IV secretory pathway VirJ component
MLDQSDDLNLSGDSTPPLKEESNNRTFIIAAGILAGVVFLSIACMAAYALVILPRQKAATAAHEATIQAQNAQVAQAMTQTAEAAFWTPTALPSPLPTATSTPPTLSPTPVVALVTAASTATSTLNPMALLGLLATQTAIANKTAAAMVTATALASTGFADEFGLPGLIVLAVVLVVVILLARRLRARPAS